MLNKIIGTNVCKKAVMLQEHLEKLIETGFKLITLETLSPEQTVNDFRPLVREGKAIYLWDQKTGLRRMEASHINIPKTNTPESVLRHIQKSKLYGIYLLLGFNKDLGRQSLHPILKQISAEEKMDKIVIFIDNHFDFPLSLLDKTLMVQEPDVKHTLQ